MLYQHRRTGHFYHNLDDDLDLDLDDDLDVDVDVDDLDDDLDLDDINEDMYDQGGDGTAQGTPRCWFPTVGSRRRNWYTAFYVVI